MLSVIKTFIKLVLGRGIGSQFGEDKVVLSIFPECGTYVDVGAYHPHLYSNTYALYRKGWSGVAVEPNPDMTWLWRIFRPRDRFINGAVGKRGSSVYYIYKDGAYNGFSPLLNRPMIAQKTMDVIPLSDLLREQVDFLNIDCEGMDHEILQTHDWSTKPRVIAIEGEENGEANALLVSKGYKLHTKAGMTLIYTLQRTPVA